eukprot:scaffold3290_cov165-Ochromonas_danica.AAC.34
MSKGMWTKHLTADGKAFYYNASQNRSVWTAPSDSVVHEAPNLKPPGATNELQANTAAGSGDPVVRHPSIEVAQSRPMNTVALSTVATASTQDDEAAKNEAYTIDFQAKIDAAVAQKQKELAVKRFNAKKASEEEHQLEKGELSDYLKQKNELQKLSGNKGDDASKWLVR